MLNFPLVRSEVGIYKKQGCSVQVNTDAQAAFIANPPTDEAGGNRGF